MNDEKERLVEEREFHLFIERFKKKTGVDLRLYKEPQMRRRLTTLRDKKGFAFFSQFAEAMERDPQLVKECLDRLTINVTQFFRNRDRWKVLEEKILPRLIAEGRPLKLWSAACSTGEEPYSLVMLLDQLLPGRDVCVLASDIDEHALAQARLGIYPPRSVQEVPSRYLEAYFTVQNGYYHLAESIKERVKFERQNLLADPFGEQFDLILCRNVMIYFTQEAKDLLYKKFSRALSPGGILFVGSTEQIFYPASYGLESEEPFFYRKL